MTKAWKVTRVVLPLLLLMGYAGFLIYYPTHSSSPANAINGEVFITDLSFDSGGVLNLSGDWEFYYEQLLSAEDFPQVAEAYSKVPGQWRAEHKGDTIFYANGYGTYRLTLRFESPKEIISLVMPTIQGAYELLVNGRPVLSCGVVGTSKESEQADVRIKTAAVPLGSDRAEIIVRMSGFVSASGGMRNSVFIGSAGAVSDYIRRESGKDALIIGCFSVMFFYHGALFFFRRMDIANLLFALLSLVCAIRQGTVSQALLLSALPYGNAWGGYCLYMLSTIWMYGLSVLLFYRMFGKKYGVGRKTRLLTSAAFTAFSVLQLMGIPIASQIALVIVWYAACIACGVTAIRILWVMLRKRDEYSFLYAYGIAFLLLACSCDILNDVALVPTLAGPSAFIAFLFVEAVILARKYTNFAYENERLNIGLEQEVAERTAELHGANEQLKRMEASRRELMSNISHDLRTPITAISGYMELLREDPSLGEPAKDYVESSDRRIKQIDGLISDLFLLTRLQDGGLRINTGEMSMSAFSSECFRDYQPIVKAKGLALKLECDDDPLIVSGDRLRLMQAADNLMRNAIAYARSEITIRCVREGRGVLFSVLDDGEGIAPELMERLFERFYKGQQDGAGLGLAITREIVTRHGGDTFAASTPYKATEIGFTLPLM